MSVQHQPRRNAFTLIELVVVIIIIAILAAVAVPKFQDRADAAREAASYQSLSTLRGAIEMYRADNGSYPTTLATDLTTYIKGAFPSVSIGGTPSAAVAASTATPVIADGAEAGWIYNATTGEIRVNMAAHDHL